MARISTHVLDTARGVPAAGIAIDLYLCSAAAREKIAAAITNLDGRTDQPLVSSDHLIPGTYELVFHAGEYIASTSTAEPQFLDEITIRFIVADAQGHYHVPLLLAPYGYSTYRGS